MYAVLDTNQALALPKAGAADAPGLTLAPYVIAEILLRSDPEPSIRRIRSFRVRYGLQLAPEALEQVAGLTESELLHFRPFLAPGTVVASDSLYAGLRPDLAPIPDAVRARAIATKGLARAFCGSMFGRSVRARERFRSVGGAPKFRDLEEALLWLDDWPESVADIISNGSARPLAVPDPRRLYSAVMQNPFLARLFRSILSYQLSWFRLWADPSLNFDPSSRRDDFTDLVLPFYAEDGDVILTADKKLTSLLKMVAPNGAVAAATASDIQLG